MSSIDELLNKLVKYPNSDIVANPYHEEYAVDNLKQYFEYMFNQDGKRILLVAEAPGYKGCAITGIPLTSGRVFQEISHPLLLNLKDKIYLPRLESENTATIAQRHIFDVIVWSYLATKKTTPLFWNSFPFHPHHQGNLSSNRSPNSSEVKYGSEILRELCKIYQPEAIAGIGKKGLAVLQQTFSGQFFDYIRHPSYGGKLQFIEGMNNIIK